MGKLVKKSGLKKSGRLRISRGVLKIFSACMCLTGLRGLFHFPGLRGLEDHVAQR